MKSVFYVAVETTTSIILPRKKDFDSECEAIIQRIKGHSYQKVMRSFFNDDSSDREFWTASDGLSGIGDLLLVSYLYFQLVQAFRRRGLLTKDQARNTWQMIIWQAVFTTLSIPEAVLCHICKKLHHICAKESVRFFCDITTQVYCVCVTDGAPKCVSKLHELL